MVINETMESGLSAIRIELPTPNVNLRPAKAIGVTRTISGHGSVSVWAGTMSGERRELDITVTSSQLKQLESALNTGVNEWLVRIGGRIFRAVLDLSTAIKGKTPESHSIRLVMVILREIGK